MKLQKPYAPSCDENKDGILAALKTILTDANRRLIEIGSGTGQHAVHFAPHFKNLQWVTSDAPGKLQGIKMWLKDARLPNVHGPLAYEIGKDAFPRQHFDAAYASNVFHILPWKTCKTLMKDLGNRLRKGAKVVFYGAFNYGGKFTCESNEAFDRSLKAEDPLRGIRNFEDVHKAMTKAGFELTKDIPMPFDNRLLYFTRLEHQTLK